MRQGFGFDIGGCRTSGNGRERRHTAFAQFLDVKAVVGWSLARAAE